MVQLLVSPGDCNCFPEALLEFSRLPHLLSLSLSECLIFKMVSSSPSPSSLQLSPSPAPAASCPQGIPLPSPTGWLTSKTSGAVHLVDGLAGFLKSPVGPRVLWDSRDAGSVWVEDGCGPGRHVTHRQWLSTRVALWLPSLGLKISLLSH